VATLPGHLSPKPLLIAVRFRFHKRDQRDDENINTYVAEIKKLSEHCEFGTALNDSLRGRFVCGLYNESIQKRILSKPALRWRKRKNLQLPWKGKTIPPVNSIREVPMQHKCYRCWKEIF
jgi:hypothetical protein